MLAMLFVKERCCYVFLSIVFCAFVDDFDLSVGAVMSLLLLKKEI